MVTIEEARQSVLQARELVAQKRQEAEQTEQKLREQQNRLNSQRSLRQGGLQSFRVRQQGLRQTGEGIKSVQNYRAEVIQPYESQISQTEQGIQDYERQEQAYNAEKSAYDVAKKAFYGTNTTLQSAVRSGQEGSRAKYYFNEFENERDAANEVNAAIAKFNAGVPEREAFKGLNVDFLRKRGVIQTKDIPEPQLQSKFDIGNKMFTPVPDTTRLERNSRTFFDGVKFTPTGLISAQTIEPYQTKVPPEYQPPQIRQSLYAPYQTPVPFTPAPSIKEKPIFFENLNRLGSPREINERAAIFPLSFKKNAENTLIANAFLNQKQAEYSKRLLEAKESSSAFQPYVDEYGIRRNVGVKTPASVQREVSELQANRLFGIGLLGASATTRAIAAPFQKLTRVTRILTPYEEMELASVKNTQQRLKDLSKLKFVDETQGIVNVKPFTYLGSGTKLSSQEVRAAQTLLPESELLISNKIKPTIQDIGKYRQEVEIYPIKQGGKPFKYSPYLNEPTQTERFLLSQTTKQGKITTGLGLGYGIGSQGRLVNREVVTSVSKGGVTEFNLFEPARSSKRIIPSDAGNLILEITPTGRRTGMEVARTKTLFQGREGDVLGRVYRTEYKRIPVRPRRTNIFGMKNTYNKKPTFNQFGYAPREEYVRDIIFLGKQEVSGGVKVKATDNFIMGKAIKNTNQPFVQFAEAYPQGTKYISESFPFIEKSGKRSSNLYLKQLYAEEPLITLPTTRVKPSSIKALKTSKVITTQTGAKPINTRLPSSSYGIGVLAGQGSRDFSWSDVRPTNPFSSFSSGFKQDFIQQASKQTSAQNFLTGNTISQPFNFLSTNQNTQSLGTQVKSNTRLDVLGFSDLRVDTKPLTAQKVRNALDILRASKIDTQVKEDVGIKTRVRVDTKLNTALKQLLQTKSVQRQISRSRGRGKGRGNFNFGNSNSITGTVKPNALDSGFDVFVRTRGKDIKKRRFESREEAFDFLLGNLRGTLRASGFVTQGGRKIKPSEDIFGSMFRPAKSDPFRVVEKRSRRLDTSSEVSEILGFGKKRKKGGKIDWF